MNTGGTRERHAEFLDLASRWVQPPNLIRRPKIRYPHNSILVRAPAKRHAVRPRQLVRYVDNPHGLVGKWRRNQILVVRHTVHSSRHSGILTADDIKIRNHDRGIVIGERREAVLHDKPHEVDRLRPPRLVPPRG